LGAKRLAQRRRLTPEKGKDDCGGEKKIENILERAGEEGVYNRFFEEHGVVERGELYGGDL